MRPQLNLALFLTVSALALATGSAFAQAPGASSTILVVPPSRPAANAQGAPDTAGMPALTVMKPGATADRDAAPLPAPVRNSFIRPDEQGPDESALRYYVSVNEAKRVKTEIDRLRRLYPNWQVPQDLYSTAAPGGVDEEPLWDLFSTDRLDQLHAEIDARMKQEPDWQPSQDLLQKLRRKDVRYRIDTLWQAGKWKELVEFVKADGYSSDDVDVATLWVIAEAYAKTKQTADAVKVYGSILSTSTDTPQRIATIQKAMQTLRMSDVETLIAMGKMDANGASEFTPIMVDIVRARISAFLHDERTAEVSAAEMQVFENYAREAEDPNQPGLIAWYYYKTKVYQDALEWFKYSLSRGGDAMIAHGLAHSLRSLDMKRETEEVSFAWREPLVNNLIVFIDILETDLTKAIPPYIEPERLARYARVSMETASGEGAQALA